MFKKNALTGTTALLGLVLAASGVAAQTAGPKAPFKAVLDGEVNANFGVQSTTQNTAHARQFGMQQSAWMRFFFEGKADNGLTYGWYVRILGDSSSISVDKFANDREAMYFRHPSWGTVEVGNGTGSGKRGFPFVTADWGPPTSSQNYLGPDGKLERLFVTDPNGTTILGLFDKVGTDDAFPSGRAQHIWYGTPDWNGFSLNGDYTPDGATRNDENFVTSTQAGAPSTTQALSESNFQNTVSIGLNYQGTIGPVALATGIQYAHAQSKNNYGLIGGSSFATQAFRDANSFHTGFKAHYAGFQWGVDYSYYGHSALPKQLALGTNEPVTTWGWGTGLEYFTGPWVIGGYYTYSRGAGVAFPSGTTSVALNGVAQTPNGEFESDRYAVGVGYTVAPGLKLYSEFFYYDLLNSHVTEAVNARSSGNPRNPHGQIFIIGTSFAW